MSVNNEFPLVPPLIISEIPEYTNKVLLTSLYGSYKKPDNVKFKVSGESTTLIFCDFIMGLHIHTKLWTHPDFDLHQL